MSEKFTKNILGRRIPEVVNGLAQIPFSGIGKHKPSGRKYGPALVSCSDFPADGNKTVASLEQALLNAGLRDGAVIRPIIISGMVI
jgi:citrate lyase subunit alpha / citrate CoA-transferase